MSEHTVTLRLTSNTQGLVTGVVLAKKETQGLGDTVEKNGKRSASALKAAAAAGKLVGTAIAGSLTVAAATLASWTKQTIEQARATERLAAIAGTSNVEFQRWASGAREAGIEQDKLADILKDTQDKIGDFLQTGGGGMADFFENIAPAVGVTAEQFRRLSGPEALQLYVDSLEAANLSQSEMAFYLEAIASDSTLLLPLLRNGGSAMKHYGDEAERLGAVMSDEVIDSTKELQKITREMSAQFTAFKTELVMELIPSIQLLADEINSSEFKTGFASITEGAITATVKVAELVSGIGNLTRFLAEEVAARVSGPALDDIVRIEDAITRQRTLIADIEKNARPHLAHSRFARPADVLGIEAQRAELARLEAMLTLARSTQDEAAAAAARHTAALNNQTAAANKTTHQERDRSQQLNITTERDRQAADAALQHAEALKKHQQEQYQINVEIERWAAQLLPQSERAAVEYQLALDELDQQYKDGALTTDQYTRSITLLGLEYQQTSKQMAESADVIGRMKAEVNEEIRLLGMSAESRRVEALYLRLINEAKADWQGLSDAEITLRKEEIRLASEAAIAQLSLAENAANAKQQAVQAAEQSAQAWSDFAGGLADAVLNGASGVKTYFKRLLDDLKRQLLSSGLLSLFKSIFNVSGAAGGGFTSMLGAMLGGNGMSGGSILSAGIGGGSGGGLGGFGSLLSSSISGGISSGLMSLGSLISGGASTGFGVGLTSAGMHMASGGFFGGLASSFGAGMSSMGAGSILTGLGQMLPMIGTVLMGAQLIDSLSGGRLFGTGYEFDSAGRNLNFGSDGVSGQDRTTEVRQRSLFRGRKWRDSYTDIDAETMASLEAFWSGITTANNQIARTLGGSAAVSITASFAQEFDKDGKVISEIGTILGRKYTESWDVFAQRIAAENIIANIDAALGNTVAGSVSSGNDSGSGGDGSGEFRQIGDTIEKIGNSVAGGVGQLGEASAIAERWRHDAELLAQGASFLLIAATDMHNGANLLIDGSLTQITDLIEELATEGESLVDAYSRVAGSAALLDQALALSGVSIEGTREHIVRLATSITEAAGGLEQAQALWASYFSNFYSAGELAQYNQSQLMAGANAAFSGAGLDISGYLGAGGMEQFRADFEAAMPTLSPEQIAQWLRAADALAAVTSSSRAITAALDNNAWSLHLDTLTQAERSIAEVNRTYDEMREEFVATGASLEQLARLEDQRTEALARAQAAIDAELNTLIGDITFDNALAGMSDFEAQIARINAQYDDYIAQAMALGASEEQLAIIRAAGADAVARAQAAEEDRLRAAFENYQGLVRGLQDELDADSMSEFALAMRDIERWTAETSQQLNEAAQAAGLQSAAEADLATVHAVAAQRAAKAIEQLRASAATLVTELFGPAEGSLEAINARIADIESQSEASFSGVSDDIEAAVNAWLSGIQRVQDFLDDLLLDKSLTTLTPEQQLAEAQNQYETVLAAAQRGDADALSALPDAARSLLDIARSFHSSGDAYTGIFESVRDGLQGVTGLPAPVTTGGDANYGASSAVSNELAALYAERDALLAEQEAAQRAEMIESLGGMIRELIQATGQPLSEVATSIGLNLGELANSLGINLNDMSASTATGLVEMARLLGVDVAELASNVGISLGSLADEQSLLNQALSGELDKLPDGTGDALKPYLDAITAATSEADANAAIDAMSAHIQTLDAGIRNQLAPYFAGLDPAPMLTELTALANIDATAQAQLLAANTANDFLARIANNLNVSNAAEGLPAFAAGGWVNGPTKLLAGEAGRELILPNAVSEFFQRTGIPINAPTNQDLTAELRAMREELRQLRAEQRQNASALAQATMQAGEKVSQRIDKQTDADDRRSRELVASLPRAGR